MDVRNLMYGDYVAIGYDRKPHTITRCGHSFISGKFVVVCDDGKEYQDNDVHPIALTKEMLLANDFIATDTDHDIVSYNYDIIQKNAVIFDDGKLKFDARISIHIDINVVTNEIRKISIDNFLQDGATKFEIVNPNGVYFVHEFQQMLRTSKAKTLANNFKLK